MCSYNKLTHLGKCRMTKQSNCPIVRISYDLMILKKDRTCRSKNPFSMYCSMARLTRKSTDIFYGLVALILMVHCIDFDINLFGVEFDPFVKHPENGEHFHRSNYTFQNLKTMLEVVSTKFGKISYTISPYMRRVAEAAALINLERRNKSLTVVIRDSHTAYVGLDLEAAVKAAQLANSIYRGTVTGVELQSDDFRTMAAANSTRFWMKKLRQMTQGQGLSVGWAVKSLLPRSKIDNIWGIIDQAILLSDFIVYDSEAVEGLYIKFLEKPNVSLSFLQESTKARNFRNDVQKVNSNTVVIWRTSWTAKENLFRTRINDMKAYWELANEFAVTMKYPVYLSRAFDSPSDYYAYTGWWRLARNDQINFVSGYIEQFSGKPVQIGYNSTHPCFRTNETSTIAPKAHVSVSNNSRTSKGNTRDTSIPSQTHSERQDPKILPTRVGQLATSTPKLFEILMNKTVHNNSVISNLSDGIDQNMKSHAQGLTAVDIAVYVASILVFLVFLNAFVCLFFKYRKSVRSILTRREIDEFKFGLLNSYDSVQVNENYGYIPGLNLPYDLAMEIPKQRLKIFTGQILGSGEFGLVCKAVLRNGTDREVAVKMLKENSTPCALKGILSEIKVLGYLGKHPNIASICGAYTAEIQKGLVYLAMELCPLGSLKGYLRNFRSLSAKSSFSSTNTTNPMTLNDGFTVIDQFRWSHEIACGMKYLEQKNVLHADLATRNVLLTADKTAKITDFGLSRRLNEYANYTKQSQEPLPWRWMAFESLKRTEFSIKSDVWSYGVTLWEIFTLGDLPFPAQSWSQDFIDAIEHGLRLGQPPKAPVEMYWIMTNCWKLLPEERPTFFELYNQTKVFYCVNATAENGDTCVWI